MLLWLVVAYLVVSIGIGINTGNVVFGSVGARDRMDFTSIGDTVNLQVERDGKVLTLAVTLGSSAQ